MSGGSDSTSSMLMMTGTWRAPTDNDQLYLLLFC